MGRPVQANVPAALLEPGLQSDITSEIDRAGITGQQFHTGENDDGDHCERRHAQGQSSKYQPEHGIPESVRESRASSG